MSKKIRRLPLQLQAMTLACITFTAAAALGDEPAVVATNPSALSDAYKAAELAAPQSARMDLDALRVQGKDKGWLFSVGYTSAFAAPLDTIAGTKIPENFLALAIAQNEFASKANGAAAER